MVRISANFWDQRLNRKWKVRYLWDRQELVTVTGKLRVIATRSCQQILNP